MGIAIQLHTHTYAMRVRRYTVATLKAISTDNTSVSSVVTVSFEMKTTTITLQILYTQFTHSLISVDNRRRSWKIAEEFNRDELNFG